MTGRVVLVGVVLLWCGVVLTVVGSFLPLYGVAMAPTPEFEGYRFGLTSWGDFHEPPLPAEAAPGVPRTAEYGYGLLAGAALAGFGAVRARHVSGRAGAVAGAGVLAGTVWAAWQGSLLLYPGDVPEGTGMEKFVGPGVWLLAAACACTAVGAFLVHGLPRRASKPEGPSVIRVDDDHDATPPFGFPAPAVRLPGDEGHPSG
ncbi:hypothetical protein GCM10022243_18090 [Saccharothrix violaceirubra]|uniref:Uncharacterized protein n=1 Tax=Saccharothrix violaceirubra TaxID=413306 RepID=A0A7W7WUL8_9PSEU|nr:hypothetical protein [Saccharothrix violaceirubra]MBB4964399.1 hypothetical protein [Saccharothrix violaceirubra]